MSFELKIGHEWNQWKSEGHELPDDVPVLVVVYRDIELAEVASQFRVVRGKSDYRYLEYHRAMEFLKENVNLVEGCKQQSENADEFKMWDRVQQTLKKTQKVIAERLNA